MAEMCGNAEKLRLKKSELLPSLEKFLCKNHLIRVYLMAIVNKKGFQRPVIANCTLFENPAMEIHQFLQTSVFFQYLTAIEQGTTFVCI